MPDLRETETAVLLDCAVALARADPRHNDERWRLVSEFHRRGGATVYAAATGWCESEEPLIRALGADVLGQLGFDEGYPFADLCTPTLEHLLEDAEPEVMRSCSDRTGRDWLSKLRPQCLGMSSFRSWKLAGSVTPSEDLDAALQACCERKP